MKYHKSDKFTFTYGAPQGSCLGPLLFSIFTNDLSKHLKYTKCILLADDTTIYMSHKNVNYLSWCIEEDLAILSDWFPANLLMLNEDKSVTMSFSQESIRFTGCNICMNGISLPDVTYTKFLGMWIDNKLSWSYHINKLYLKLKSNQHLLHAGKNMLNLTARKNVYYSQIYSHISYGIIVWGNMLKKTELTKLQKIQNKCFKLCTKEEASIHNFHKHEMLRISDIIKLVNMRHGHRVQHSHLPDRILQCSKVDSNSNPLVKNRWILH